MFGEKEGQRAFELHKQIADNELERRRLLLVNMQFVNELHSSGLYKAVLGDEKAPWSAYLGQHEVFYSREKVWQYDRIWEVFVKGLRAKPEDIVDIPTSKLIALIPLINKGNLEKWLDEARALTTQDFNDEIRVAQGKVSYVDCKHRFEKYEICRDCNFRHK